MSATDGRCSQLDSAAKLQRAAFADRVIVEAAAQTGALAVIPTELFCTDPDQGCFEVDLSNEQHLMYRDFNHLSAYGSVELARKANEELGLIEFLTGNGPGL